MPLLPLPGSSFDDEDIVVASVWMNDEVEEPTALLLLLAEHAPYYSVCDILFSDGEWKIVNQETFPNIVPAVECYQDHGGDY